MATADVISVCKHLINTGTLDHVKEAYATYQEEEIAWDHVFLKVYIHACLKKRKDVVEWLTSLYNEFDPIEQIALRQTFAYGRYLLNK
jgi:hypothetical protein